MFGHVLDKIGHGDIEHHPDIADKVQDILQTFILSSSDFLEEKDRTIGASKIFTLTGKSLRPSSSVMET
jgi:hypothetical protein